MNDILSNNSQDLNDFLSEYMNKWKIPGIAVGIIKDDEIIYCNG